MNSDADGADTRAQPRRKAPQVKGARARLTPRSIAASGAIETSRQEALSVAAHARARVARARNSVLSAI